MLLQLILHSIFVFGHNIVMIYDYFISDMAEELLEKNNNVDLSKLTKLQFGVTKRFLNLKSVELSKKIGRDKGIYITFDCDDKTYFTNRGCAYLENALAETVKNLVGILKPTSPVLIVGLGNDDIVADALGSSVVKKIKTNRGLSINLTLKEQRVCAMTPGVSGETGIKTIETVRALTKEIKPSFVILIDSLATSSAVRLGKSFQISTSGIAPGSGVGQDKEKIDSKELGVNVLTIGVPLVLAMRTVLEDFIKNYLSEKNIEPDLYYYRDLLMRKKLSNLVVAPKEIKFYVDMCSAIISNALNKCFS